MAEAIAMVLEAMDAEEAEDGGPITKSAAAALPAAEMPAAAALMPAAGEAPAPAAGEAPAQAAAVAAAPALPAALVLVQRPMTGGSTEPMILTILEQPDAK